MLLLITLQHNFSEKLKKGLSIGQEDGTNVIRHVPHPNFFFLVVEGGFQREFLLQGQILPLSRMGVSQGSQQKKSKKKLGWFIGYLGQQ